LVRFQEEYREDDRHPGGAGCSTEAQNILKTSAFQDFCEPILFFLINGVNTSIIITNKDITMP
jgi:hypothetical protein